MKTAKEDLVSRYCANLADHDVISVGAAKTTMRAIELMSAADECISIVEALNKMGHDDAVMSLMPRVQGHLAAAHAITGRAVKS